MIPLQIKQPSTLLFLSRVFAITSLLLFSCDHKSTSDQPVLHSEAPPANIQPPPASIPATDKLEFLRLQAEAGRTAQQYKYAYYLTIHQQQPSDLVLAKDWFQKAAESGHLEAAYRLGVIQAEGLVDGIPNLHESTKWFLKAATEGHSGAQFELGRYCLHGEGVAKSPQKALAWLQLAAHQYHAGAQYLLGRMYEIGNGVSQNSELAYKWYKLSADSGHPAALYKIAAMTESGTGTTKDRELAKDFFAKAYALGLPGKQSLGTSIAGNTQARPNSVNPYPNNISTYTNAGPAGPEGTPLNQPASYKNDDSVPVDKAIESPQVEVVSSPPPKKISISSRDSISREDDSAANTEIHSTTNQPSEETTSSNDIGASLPKPKSSSPNSSLSHDYQPNPADTGSPLALHRIALEFLNSPQSQTPDYASAITYFEKAAAKGHSPSQYQLAEIFYHGEHSQPNYPQAFIWYSLAANNQIAEAQYRLGSMFYEGKGVEKNTEKAKRWLHMAASQNNQAAISLLQQIHQQEQLKRTTSSTQTEPLNAASSTASTSDVGHASALTPNHSPSPQLTAEEWYRKGFKLYTSNVQPSKETYMEAYKYFVKAANENYGDAWYYIGKMYDYGEGLKANPVKAFECYLVAAREGNPNAQYSLGFMYETGLGCRKNTSEAYVWYALAAENGLANANQTKIGLENKMSIGEIGYAKKRLTTLREYLQNYKNKSASNQ